MHVRAPELLAVDVERAAVPQVARELVDGEVEAHPLGDAVDRGEAQAGRVRQRQQLALDRHLLLGVERDRRERRGLVDGHERVGHAAVVRARRGEHDARHAGVLDQRARALDVDGLRQLGVLGARRVADDRRQVHDRLGAVERRAAGGGVADVAAQHPGAGRLERGRHVLLAVQQRVEHRDLVAGGQQLARRRRADVAGAAGDRDPHDRDATLAPARMAHSLPVFALRRMLAAALLAVAVSALTFLTLHGLYPEAFGDTRPLLVELWHFLVATFVHFDLGRDGEIATEIGRGLGADFSLLIGAMAFGIGAGHGGRRRLRPPSRDVARAHHPAHRAARAVHAGLRHRHGRHPALQAGHRRAAAVRDPALPRLRPVLRQPAQVAALAARAVDRRRPAAGRRLHADDARGDDRDPRRGLHPHRRRQGAQPRARSACGTSCRSRCRPSSRWPAPTRRC